MFSSDHRKMVSIKWKTAVAISALCLCFGACGSPFPESGNEKGFIHLIRDLATNCTDNPLLNDPSLLGECEISDSKLNRMGLYCYSFLDINRRLCALKSQASFNISERLRVEQSKVLHYDMVCGNASGITFASLPEQPNYKSKIESVFGKKESCFWLCTSADEDDVNVKLNDFCKVLYYVSAIIKDVRDDVENANAPHFISQPSVPRSNSTNAAEARTVPQHPDAQSDAANDASPLKAEPKAADETSQSKLLAHPALNKTDTEKHLEKVEAMANANPKVDTPAHSPTSGNPIIMKEIPIQTNEAKPTGHQGIPVVSQQNPNVRLQIEDKFTSSTMSTVILNMPENPPPVPGDKPDTGEQDDYDNMPEGDDNRLTDIGNNDPATDDEDFPSKIELPRGKKIPTGKEFESANVPDVYTEEEEEQGHFFPLFFFTVGTVVVLYILYHNKNKVMGLLIEGRQTGGRRRNSHGHAYRRLDTLEQAISSSAPGAAPSKIIY